MISMAMVLVIILPINNQYSYKTDLSLSIVQIDESPIKLQSLIQNIVLLIWSWFIDGEPWRWAHFSLFHDVATIFNTCTFYTLICSPSGLDISTLVSSMIDYTWQTRWQKCTYRAIVIAKSQPASKISNNSATFRSNNFAVCKLYMACRFFVQITYLSGYSFL